MYERGTQACSKGFRKSKTEVAFDCGRILLRRKSYTIRFGQEIRSISSDYQQNADAGITDIEKKSQKALASAFERIVMVS